MWKTRFCLSSGIDANLELVTHLDVIAIICEENAPHYRKVYPLDWKVVRLCLEQQRYVERSAATDKSVGRRRHRLGFTLDPGLTLRHVCTLNF